MEGTPHINKQAEVALPYEDAIDQAIINGHAEMERRLGCPIGEAPAFERLSVATELLEEINERKDNRDRFLAEVYAGIRKLAELELDFQMAKNRLSNV